MNQEAEMEKFNSYKSRAEKRFKETGLLPRPLTDKETEEFFETLIKGESVDTEIEFLGKKVEAREMKYVMIAVLAHPLSILGFTAIACLVPATMESLANLGPHGFSEVLYAYTSGTARACYELCRGWSEL